MIAFPEVGSPRRRSILLGSFAVALTALPVGAQSGRLEGTIVDSVHARPLVAARVLAIRADSGATYSTGATTDSRGRYRVDALPVGRYMVEFESAFLDSLEIYLPPREVTIEAGRTARADFALPSGRTLRAAACPGLTLPKGKGALVGRVLDAESEAPLGDARVAVAWRELSLDRATMRVSSAERVGAVGTDSLGRYRLCGVPTDDWLVVQVQHRGRAGSDVRILVPDSAGVRVRHLSLSATASRAIAADSSVSSVSDTTTPPPLTGTAAVAGVVRGVGGLPLAEAQVRVAGASGSTVSDARGRFSLGDLPSGTQVLEVRRLGYLLTQQPVELRSGRTATQDVRLQRIVTLDSIRVLAQRSRYRDFEEHRKRKGFGSFLTEDEIDRRRPFQTSDLVFMMPGFRVSGVGLDAKVQSSRGPTSCEANIVIDGMSGQDINLLHPGSIGAMEIYRAGEPAPVQYDRGCGVIVIWSRR